MKYVVLVPDGAADYAVSERGGSTPLEAARTPNMDFLTREGVCGTALTIPEGMAAGSDVANYSILGYDPQRYYTGRGPLEAVSMGVALGPDDVAFRCNLVTESGGVLLDYSAGHISTAEAAMLVRVLREKLEDEYTAFYPGIGYRHLLVLKGLKFLEDRCTPPHDVVGRMIEEVRPRGPNAERITALMRVSRRLLADHDVNRRREEKGLRPANMIWPWGQGRLPELPAMKDRYGLAGAIITAVDLIKGLGMLAGMEVVEVPGATGYYDTDYAAKARYALESLRFSDLVYVHVEAPDEAGHEGDWEAKVEALENFDAQIVGAFLDETVRSGEEFAFLLMPDHFTPLEVRTHVADPVPFAVYYPHVVPDRGRSFSEKGVAGGSYAALPAWQLLDLLVEGTRRS
ncbi:MAG: cofactor-independent phosphoglycerate mutase [Actinomycetota bacterium]|nr:cofactor-independent phosphoglycerate mutase [Actinomycetota bacterium]MDD5666109.1 cofactor-independent phosphoglycerate mutase [Actinomycetota bacterium]